jgi:inner membrane transporter RhtA
LKEEIMSEEIRCYEGPAISQWNLVSMLERLVPRSRQRRSVVASVPPPVLVLFSIISVQLGAALAKGLFQQIGPGGTVLVRCSFAALALMVFWRPRFRAHRRAEYGLIILYGLTIAGMNAAFYASIARIPLGIASTLEFLGPLGVAVAASRHRLDFLWVGLATAGLVLLAPIGNMVIDPLGIGLALLAGVGWAAYILLTVQVGQAFSGGTGLALGMSVAALALIPLGVANGGEALLHPRTLLLGVGVAILSTLIPFSLEFEALRRLPARVFGVLMSLEPAIAALIGFIVLGETASLRVVIALVLIVMASGGSSFFQRRENDTTS